MRRRAFLRGATGWLLSRNCLISSGTQTNRFVTPEADIKMVAEFHDRYASRGFWFIDDTTGRRFCLSSAGKTNQNCLRRS